MWNHSRYWLALCCCGLLWLGCAPAAWQPHESSGLTLESCRYLDKCYRSSDFKPAAAVYQIKTFPVEQVSGLSQEQARALFNEELLKAMTANGLSVNQEDFAGSRERKPKTSQSKIIEAQAKPEVRLAKPEVSLIKPKINQEEPTPALILSGVVDRLVVASPTWRFFSGRGHANLRVLGEIRRGQEVVFAFQDEVTVNPSINPRHRPALEPDLIARLVIRRFTTDLLNELLLPPKHGAEEIVPASATPNH